MLFIAILVDIKSQKAKQWQGNGGAIEMTSIKVVDKNY